MDVYCKNHMKHVVNLPGQNTEFLTLNLAVLYIYEAPGFKGLR